MFDWKRWVSSAAYATITTVVAVFSGLLGSVYQNEIVSAFPLRWRGPWGPVSWHAVEFWSSLILFGLMFFARQRSDDAERRALAETVQTAKDNTSRIEALVRTMPPRAFRAQLARLVTTSHNILAKALPRDGGSALTQEDVVALARFLLNSIAHLALIFDDQPVTPDGPASYSANVMIYIAKADDGTLPAEVHSLLRFHPDRTNVSGLRGVLVLRPDLSSTSDTSGEPVPDPNLSAFALPVPFEMRANSRWNALPGAPKAFLEGQIDGHRDTHTLGHWCRGSGNFSEETAQELERYFSDEEGRHVRSFISRPLRGPDGGAFGVLNLHSNRTRILGEPDERLDDFFSMLTPLYLDLQATLMLLPELGTRPPEAPLRRPSGGGTLSSGSQT